MKNKVLFVWPSVDYSIMDVATGIYEQFIKNDIELVDYRLNNRMKILAAGINEYKPVDKDLPLETIALHASEGLPYYAIVNRTKWVFVVSGLGLHPNALAALKSIGCKIAVYFTESPYNTEEELEIAKLIDLAFVNERTVVKQFEQIIDGPVHYIQHSYNPEVHKYIESKEKDLDLFFLGTGFVDRQLLFEGMDFEGINFEFGGMFSGLEEPNYLTKYYKYGCINNTELVNLYSRTKILLNPHRYAPGAESANPRIYEGAACKIFQISDYRKEIEDIFGDSIPMYTHSVPWEANALIRRYLNDPETRFNMIEESYRKVQPYTFEKQVKIIVSELERIG